MSAMALVLESSVRALAIALAVGGVLALCGVRAGRVRDAAWVAVLGAMLLMPVLIVYLPALPAPIVVTAPRVVLAWFPARDVVSAPASPPPLLTASTERDLPLLVSSSAGDVVAATREPAAVPSIDWRRIAAVSYVAVVALLLARLAAGWAACQRLVRSSRPLFGVVFESGSVASPMTTGILRRRVVLPLSWRQWSGPTMNAVLAHELAHVRRRDVCVTAIAGINRSVFWFHPLAWWLEHRIAVSAEHAADDAAIATAGGGHAYAEILLQIADSVRQRGGRVAWQGIGMAGHAPLAQRIDRALSGRTPQRLSRLRLALVATGCTTAIVVGAACQRASVPAPPLQPDPEIAAEIDARRAYREQIRRAYTMSPTELDAAQARWVANPGDDALARTLLAAYEPVHNGKWVEASRGRVPARRQIILWFIENRPDNIIARSAAITLRPGNKLPDPAGYAQAHALWLRHLENPNLTARALSNAAAFFSFTDPERSEQILLRARAIDPKGGAQTDGVMQVSDSFNAELGRLYGGAVSGLVRDDQGRATVSRERLASSFAVRARKALDDSQDATTLVAAAQTLIFFRRTDIAAILGFDPYALGQSYAERAVRLDPANDAARQILNGFSRRTIAFPSFLRVETGADIDAVIDNAIKDGNADEISNVIAYVYMAGEAREHSPKPETADESWKRTRLFAERAVSRALEFKDGRSRNAVLVTAHHALGLIALRDGNGVAAARELALAGEAVDPDDARMFRRSLEARLTSTLLKCGVYEPVAAYFDKLAQAGINRNESEAAAAAIRAGRMPKYFQRLLASYEDAAQWTKDSKVRRPLTPR